MRALAYMLFAATTACAAAPVRPAPSPFVRAAGPDLRTQVEPMAADMADELQRGGRGLKLGVVEMNAGDATDPRLAAALAEHLQNALRRGGLRVIERARLEAAMGELQLSAGDLFQAGSGARAGKLLGLELAVTGTLYADGEDYRVHLRAVDVERGTVAYSGSFAIALSDDIRRLTGRLVPGTITVWAPAGTPVLVDGQSRTLSREGERFEASAGNHVLEVTLEDTTDTTEVLVPEGGNINLRPARVVPSTFETSIVTWNAVLPGSTGLEPEPAWVLAPAAGFYAALGAIVYDLNNPPRGFLSDRQQRAAERAFYANMRYDYYALGAFYALTLAGSVVQAARVKTAKPRIQWSVAPAWRAKEGALALHVAF